MTLWNAILPVVSLLLGLVASTVLDARRDRHALRVERARRREDFELKTLMDLDAALRKVELTMLDVADMTDEDRQALGRGSKGDPFMLDQLDVLRLLSLTLDNAVREQVRLGLDALHTYYARFATFLEAERSGKTAPIPKLEEIGQAWGVAEAAHECLGARVRALYAGAVTTS